MSNDGPQALATVRRSALAGAASGASTRVNPRAASVEPTVGGGEALRDTIPLWQAAAVTVVVALPFSLWLGNYSLAAATLIDLRVVAANDVSMLLVFFVGFCALIYGMRFAPITQRGTLPFLNGA